MNRLGFGPNASARGERRILFPFVGSVLSERSLEAALRIARAQGRP